MESCFLAVWRSDEDNRGMITKDHILSEIRGTAAQNGGASLGWKRFYAETGIKESDWHGKYWVRWSDAISDAGLSPNCLSVAMSDDDLLSAAATLVKELGHFPVKGEFRLKARATPGFPSYNTFARFGTKTSFAARLYVFLMERGEEALAALYAPVAEKAYETGPAPEPVSDVEFGFVYLIKLGRYYKIGRTNAVGRREYELAIQLPEKPKLIHSIKTDDPAGIEEDWHKRFASKRTNGEWFELDAMDVGAFRRRKSM
jgi:hypothetical protein